MIQANPANLPMKNTGREPQVHVPSRRAAEWGEFSMHVTHHIETYTVPQYGDKGNDLASEYTPEECMAQLKRYLARTGRNARGSDEAKRDLLKMAHYIQLAWSANNG